jgi:hypothetical protein
MTNHQLLMESRLTNKTDPYHYASEYMEEFMWIYRARLLSDVPMKRKQYRL